MHFNNCVKSINKQFNYDLKNVANWLKTNRISHHVGKTELLLFTSPKKQIHSDLEIKLPGKRLHETDSVNYLGIQIDKSLSWKKQISHVVVKLNKTKAC